MESNRKTTIVIAAAVVGLLLLLIIYTLAQRASTPPADILPTPAGAGPVQVTTAQIQQNLKKLIPKRPATLPTKGPGLGIDTQAKTTQESIAEVQKLQAFLPYSTSYTGPGNTNFRVAIPARTSSDNAWTLRIAVLGIDYQVPRNDLQAQNEKAAFLQGAQLALDYIHSKGADPTKISVVWGDKKFVHDRALEWLGK